MNVVEANYSKYQLAEASNNPLVAALPEPLDPKKMVQATSKRIIVPEKVLEMGDFWRKTIIEGMRETYLPDPDFLPLYHAINVVLFSGYLSRNPLSSETMSLGYRVATDQKLCLSVNDTVCTAILLMGLSGRGKTLAVRRVLSLLPQVIRHTEFNGASFQHDQLVYVCMEVAGNKKQRGFLANFFFAVDEALGTTYFKEHCVKSADVSTMLKHARLVAIRHSIGLIFVDEIQRCVSSSSEAEWTTLNFIESVFNAIRVPVVSAGTYGAAPLFDKTMSTTRRLTSGRTFDYNRLSGDTGYWKRLVDAFYYPELLKKDFRFNESISAVAHDLSQGLPGVLARLMTRSYDYAIESGEEKISVDLMRQVFDLQFEALKPALKALKTGNYGVYEDLARPRGHLVDLNSTSASDNTREVFAIMENPDDPVIAVGEPTGQYFEPKSDLRQLIGKSSDEIDQILADRLEAKT